MFVCVLQFTSNYSVKWIGRNFKVVSILFHSDFLLSTINEIKVWPWHPWMRRVRTRVQLIWQAGKQPWTSCTPSSTWSSSSRACWATPWLCGCCAASSGQRFTITNTFIKPDAHCFILDTICPSETNFLNAKRFLWSLVWNVGRLLTIAIKFGLWWNPGCVRSFESCSDFSYVNWQI